MEMEEMKVAWGRLETRLAETEKINAKMLREMISRTASRGVWGLLNYEVFGLLLLLVATPFMVYRGSVIFPHYDSVSLIVLFCLLGLAFLTQGVAQFYKISLFSGVDMNVPVRDNLLRIERYHLFIQREKIVSLLVVGVLLLVSLWAFRQHLDAWRWTALLALFPLSGLVWYYTYKKINGQLQKIRQSLSELEELK